jgi:hypothetical protein
VRWIVIALVLVLACPHAWAGEGRRALDLRVDFAPGLPPQLPGELSIAIRARLGRSYTSPIRIRLDATGADVAVGELSRRVAIESWDDPAAVHLIVLHVVDLVQPGPDPEELPALAVVAAPARRHSPWTVLTLPLVGRGLDDTDPWMGGGRIAVDHARGRWHIGLDVGWWHGLRHRAGTPEDASLDAWPLSASVAVELGPVELGARLGAEWLSLTGATSDRGLGATTGAQVRVRRGLGGPFALVIEIGAELRSSRVELMRSSFTRYSTPRVASTVGLGLAWEVGP